jgi:putative MATE family efflux protein
MKTPLIAGQDAKDTFGRTFNRALITLVLPIAWQNLIVAAAFSADILMLGVVSQSAMAAVSLAGQVTFVLMLFYMGLATGAGILTAQYWGKKDITAIQHVLNIASLFSFGISVLFFTFSLAFPATLMRIFTSDNELIAYGATFLRYVSFAYLAMGLSQMYFSVARSMENAHVSAWISSLSLLLNIALDALCVFVLFPGMPEKAIAGVALATVAARFLELGCCIVHSLTRGNVKFRLPGRGDVQRSLMKDYLKYTLPVQANYIVWGGALTATVTIIGHVSADMVAANSVTSVVRNLAIVLCIGIASGGSVLVGKYLGSGDMQMAKRAGNRINLYAFAFGVLAALAIVLTRPLVFRVVDLNQTAQGYLSGMLYICALYCIGKSMNATNIGGIFCAGGDTRFGFWCDTIVMWGVILPLSYACAFVWQVHPVALYAVICLDEAIKLPVVVIRYRQYKWLRNITRQFAPEPEIG